MLSFILGKTYSWGSNSIVFDKNNTIVTPWGNGTYKCLENNKVNANWNGYNHILSFNDTFTKFDWTSNKNTSGSEVLLERMPITSYLNLNNFRSFEGFSDQVPEQVVLLKELTSTPGINLLEIGFNAGHSSDNFLRNNKSLKMTSFDLGAYAYGRFAKEYIDSNYPNRHMLILGDSTQKIPEFILNNKGSTFDVIFIDGGHDYQVVKADLDNCRKLSNKDTIVMVDDVVFTKGWEESYTLGPTQIWNEYIRDNKIIELGRRDFMPGRGMVWGKYC